MEVGGIELVCPACGGALEQRTDALYCAACARSYPVILGIPDLRLWPDPYIGLDEDRAKARMLAESCAGLDFTQSVELYYRMTAAVPPFQARRFARGLAAAAARSASLLRRLEARHGEPAARRLLDLGCGTAPLLAAAAGRYAPAAGADIALRWLVLAQKRLQERDVRAALVCACAEALPFRASSFDIAIAESTVEHVRDQPRALAECHRVLRGNGALLLTTPNRHSLGPDPHTGLPAGGWLPDRWTAAYVRRKGGVAPQRRLLTSRGLAELVARAGFADVHVVPARIPDGQAAAFGRAARLAVQLYGQLSRARIGAHLLRAIGPLLEAEARKPAAEAQR